MLSDSEIIAPVYGLEEGENELQMSGFEFMNTIGMALNV